MTKLNELKKIVVNKIDNSEYNLTKIKGISLSRSDLDDIILYIDNYLRYNDFTAYNQFMKPMGNIKEVLYKFL